MGLKMMANIHVGNDRKLAKNNTPLPSKRKGPVSTSTKQSKGYVTIQGIQSETSYQEQDWPVFTEKELMDNAYDFLNDYYDNKTREVRKIAVRVKVDSTTTPKILRIAVRNSNIDNIPVFENLEGIFEYNRWFSTKRHQHRMTTGALGDFLKRVLGMGYASWTSINNSEDSFMDRQWEEPVTLRFNGQEYKIFIIVDNETISTRMEGPTKFDESDKSTEVEVSLPVPTYSSIAPNTLLEKLEEYYKKYKLVKSKTDFTFSKEEAN
jgi:hypothetical protein